jgi:hypothetical protein
MELSKENVELILSVAKEMGITQKNDPASLTLSASALHGTLQGNSAQYGLFSDPTARTQMFSTLVRPRSLFRLIMQRGGFVKSTYDNEILEVMTGVTAASGTNATGWCANPPTTPQGKKAKLNYGWGSFYGKTQLNALPDLGGQRHRGDVPREILNASPENNPLIPSLMYQLTDTRSQLAYELYLFGVATERSVTKVGIQGNRSLNSTQTNWGWIQEFAGLDGQIKTGYADADTGVAVPSIDSWVVSWNADIAATVSGSNLVQGITDAVWTVKDRMSSMGMEGAELAIVMRPEQFRPVVENWACNYATYRCSGAAGTPIVQDAGEVNGFRLEMLRGQYLLIDGEAIQVVFDEGIPRQSLAANMFSSDIYVQPISWAGIPLTKIEYFDMDNQYLQEFADFVDPNKVRTLNNGLWLVGMRDTGLCMEYHFAAKMRMIVETPWLAARVDDVQYTVRTGQRLADPADTFFHANGGRTINV